MVFAKVISVEHGVGNQITLEKKSVMAKARIAFSFPEVCQ